MARKKRKRPDLPPYEVFLEANQGIELCGICKRPAGKRRLDRDHDHKTMKPRGLLCHRDNQSLPYWVDVPWLEAAIKYLERSH